MLFLPTLLPIGFTVLLTLPLATMALTSPEATEGGQATAHKARNDNPGGAAAIEDAVTSYLSETSLSPDLQSIAPQLSLAGVTGVIVNTASASRTRRPGDDDGDDDYANRDGTRISDGLAPATNAPQIFAMGAVGAYVLAGML